MLRVLHHLFVAVGKIQQHRIKKAIVIRTISWSDILLSIRMSIATFKGFSSLARPFKNAVAGTILPRTRSETLIRMVFPCRSLFYLSQSSFRPKANMLAQKSRLFVAGRGELFTAARSLVNSSILSNGDEDIPIGPSSGLFYFDTHKLVSSLETHGFNLEQSEAITYALSEVFNTGTTALSKYMVKKNELAQLEIRMNATIEALRKDMVILEKSEFLMLKQENESLKAEVFNLNRLLKDELLKLKSSLTLDLSLEKGRAKEESSTHEQKVKDTNNRIETEIARVRMEMEAQKLDLIKYLVGSFISIVTVLIGWWRFVKS